MKKGYGKIVICAIAAVLLIAAATFILNANRDVEKRIKRLKEGTLVTVKLTELPQGDYSSATVKFKWRYEIEIGEEKLVGTTIGTYSRSELEKDDYFMQVRYSGKESMEVPYLENHRAVSYAGCIVLYCLTLIPLLLIGWFFWSAHLNDKLRREGTLAYGRFISAEREGSYYRITYEFEIDGVTVKKRTKAVYNMTAVQAYKEMGIFEIRYKGRRAVISQTLLAVKL